MVKHTYDGASIMAGRLNGVVAHILKEAPKTHYMFIAYHIP